MADTIPTAITTMGVFLMKKGESESTYTKLIDINSFGDLGGTPELLDATTLSHYASVGVLGIQQQDTIEFEANYTKTEYSGLVAGQNTATDLSVWFGGTNSTDGTITPTGANGKFNFKGMYSLRVNGGGVNEIVHCTLTVTALTAPALDTSGS